jgi:DNA-directed RNA polymerase subunit RPC12/RpoP
MRLPASGRSRFKHGFFGVVALFVLANLVMALPIGAPDGLPFMRMEYGHSDVGFPLVFRGFMEIGGYVVTDWLFFSFDVAICLMIASGVGFVLYKFADPNRGPAHLCKGCGYDLSGIDRGVCPECGAEIDQKGRPTRSECPVPLPASGRARFKLGFLPIVVFFLVANLVTVAVVEEPQDDYLLKIQYGPNEIGYPYRMSGFQTYTGAQYIDWGALTRNVFVCLLPATALGFVLYKFAGPNRRIDYLCKDCGSDLRGIEPDVCPECGVAVDQDGEPADP